ncbi:MAG: NAD(P)/FAD-dependent oxidoreductase [Myxococcota bacterium]
MSLSNSMKSPLYDADVLVVGAGPAGLAAAIRARWVKGYRALSSSVVIFDPARPGGLLPWGGCVLSGPSWASSGEQALRPLLKDVEALKIPIIPAKVTQLLRNADGFELSTSDGRTWTGLSVVLACGLRPLGPEVKAYPQDVQVTFKGTHFLPTLVQSLAKDARGRGLLVVGHEETARLLPMLQPVAEKAGGLRFLLESPRSGSRVDLEQAGTVLRGQLERLEKGEDDRLVAVWVRLENGALQWVSAGAILMDYHAFELRPAPIPAMLGVNLETDAAGFVSVDAFLRTSIPGVFAAGDVTGRYASTLTALGDGVGAGFSAHRHAYQLKFGHEPHLFAYRPVATPLTAHPEDLPHLDDHCFPVPILGKEAFQADPEVGALVELGLSVGTLRERIGAGRLEPLLIRWIEQKALAIHRRPYATVV